MSREIKFRAWDRDLKRIVMVCDIRWLDNRPLEVKFLDEPFFHDNIDLMQYTGLKDKNGKEIYEGDVIRDGRFIGEATCTINAHGYLFYIKFPEERSWQGNKDYEVIGNIYEFPEPIK